MQLLINCERLFLSHILIIISSHFSTIFSHLILKDIKEHMELVDWRKEKQEGEKWSLYQDFGDTKLGAAISTEHFTFSLTYSLYLA